MICVFAFFSLLLNLSKTLMLNTTKEKSCCNDPVIRFWTTTTKGVNKRGLLVGDILTPNTTIITVPDVQYVRKLNIHQSNFLG